MLLIRFACFPFQRIYIYQLIISAPVKNIINLKFITNGLDYEKLGSIKLAHSGTLYTRFYERFGVNKLFVLLFYRQEKVCTEWGKMK